MPADSGSSRAVRKKRLCARGSTGWPQLQGDELAKALRYREEEAGAGPHPVARSAASRNSQYNNTVRDLLGDRSLPANQFPPEDFVNGFKNQYAAAESLAAARGRLQRRRRETRGATLSAGGDHGISWRASPRRRAARSSSGASD